MERELGSETFGLLRPLQLQPSEPHWQVAEQEKRRKDVFLQVTFGASEMSPMKFTAFSLRGR